MTSYTKALYRRDPAAADAFYKAQLFEHKLTYGRHVQLAQFNISQAKDTPKGAPKDWSALQRQSQQGQTHQAVFGKRIPSGLQACAANCGHPACKTGCTLLGRSPQAALEDGQQG